MSAITTHVLDTSRGRPATGIRVELHRKSKETWQTVGAGLTDANGRCSNLMSDGELESGTYRLIFYAGAYFQAQQAETFYSEIPVIFEVRDPNAHYHVPLLISPFGYSTYRGS
jgi:5-hydroxyisourate hydrolase